MNLINPESIFNNLLIFILNHQIIYSLIFFKFKPLIQDLFQLNLVKTITILSE